MLFSTSAYFSSTALRLIFRLGVTSPSSTLSSLGKISNFLIVGLRHISLGQVMDFLRTS